MPKLPLTTLTPGCAAAQLTADNRLDMELVVASTSRMFAAGATAWAHWTSSAASRAQLGSTAGSFVPPVWLTLRNDGGAGRPKVELKTARS
jgi:hypothetical protein